MGKTDNEINKGIEIVGSVGLLSSLFLTPQEKQDKDNYFRIHRDISNKLTRGGTVELSNSLQDLAHEMTEEICPEGAIAILKENSFRDRNGSE